MGSRAANVDRLAAEARLEGCFRLREKIERGRPAELAHAVARAKLGDKEGYRYLYTHYADNVYSYVRSIVRNDHDAEDVTQQVFAKLFSVIHRYRELDVPFTAWILRVARNAAIDHMRSDRLIPCDEVRGSEHESNEIGYDRRRCLADALESLPPEQREVVMLRHLVGLSPGENAGRIGKSESAVHGLHHRGRRALREELVRSGAAPAPAAA
jgi:RNA polymerase sigma-70 factor (ECF subfamily)